MANQALERFLQCIEHNQEQALMDFKRDFYDIATPEGQNEFLKDIMAIYNTPNELCSVVLKAIDGERYAGYLVFGVEQRNKATRKASKQAYPLPENSPKIEEATLQQLIGSRLTEPLAATYNEINIDQSILSECPEFSKQWLTPGIYGLMEIVIDTRYGPVFAKEVQGGKKKGTKNDITNKLYYRKQGIDCFIHPPQDKEIEAQIYAKFDAGYNDPNMSNALNLINEEIYLLPKTLFKALILDANDRELSEITNVLEQVAAVGCNFIFDLDQKSRECGALTVMKQLLQLPSIEVTADDIHDGAANKYADLSLDELQKGLTRLYVLMRGDPAASSQAPKLQTAHVQSFLVDLFNKIELSRPMVLFVVSLARTTRRQEMKDMVDTIQKAWETSMQGEVELLTCWLTDHKATLKCIADDQENVSVAPCEQLAHFFSLLVLERQRGVKLPASSGEIGIPDAPRMMVYLDIYDIGKGENSVLMGKDVPRKDLREIAMLDFLRGHKITPLALHFFETAQYQTYVNRRAYDNIYNLTRKGLNAMKANLISQCSIVKLYYDISAGGTTAGSVVLWRLRKEFPCVELLQLSDDAAQWIRFLYRKTRLPLCMLIDQGRHLDVNEEKVRNFFNLLRNRGQADTEIVKAVALLVQRGSKQDALDGASAWLGNSLSVEEKEQFDQLYDRARSLLSERNEPTVALYGLCQFGTSYYRLDDILLPIRNSCTGKERSLLLLCTVSFFYTHASMPLPLVAGVLKIQTDEMWEKTRLFGELKTSGNVLLLNRSYNDCSGIENGLVPVSQFVAGKILEIVFGSKQNSLPQFFDAFFALVTGIRKEAIRSLMIWSTSLFLHRSFMSENEQELEKFSNLIKDLEDHVGKDETAKYLKSITSNISSLDTDDGPHMQAMYARYLAYKLDRYDDSLNEMAKALRVQNKEKFSLTRSNDSRLLTTAGHLLLCALSQLIGSNNFELTEAQQIMRKAQTVLRRARERGNNVYPFVIEARLLYQYMNLCYIRIFHKNRTEFTTALVNGNDDLLKNAEEKARILLDELEFLLQRKNMQGFNETLTISNIEQIRCNILFLVIDIDHVTLNQYKGMCSEKPYLMRGIVDFYIIKNRRLRREMDSADLEYEENAPLSLDRQHAEKQKKPYFEQLFEVLTVEELTAIVEIFHNDIMSISATNCRHAILATIRLYEYGKYGPRQRSSNLELAMLFANRWIRLSPHDNRGYYYRGIMHFVSSFDAADLKQQKLKAAREDFKKCYELLKDNESKQRKYRCRSEMQFVLGGGYGLERLIPKDSKYEFKNLPEDRRIYFTGYAPKAENKRRLFCRDLDMFVIIPRYMYENECQRYERERPDFKFVVRIHPEGLYTEDIRPYEYRHNRR